jgi:hypothetical protein
LRRKNNTIPEKTAAGEAEGSICFHFENMSPLPTGFGLLYKSLQDYTMISEQKGNDSQNHLEFCTYFFKSGQTSQNRCPISFLEVNLRKEGK